MREGRWWLDPGSGTNDETPIAVGEIVKTYTDDRGAKPAWVWATVGEAFLVRHAV